ncbi:ABC transporter substrate-binding protein [Variovorax terrae]|uniref:ABC transporter substrate-binding protein n=1 Tax=Variovorax terrae TaxID=2923278 RepID=A0A9X1VUA8_9BURK|nr:ABC transporter substrate-binding protein [Variovorax terrae]MCJ0763936.1 ABC transporter substrate-binding protein [Variovorax terrae]
MTKVVLLYRRRWGLFYLPVVALAVAAMAWAATYWMPLPPRSLAFAAGVPQGGYMQLAERYREELRRRGIAVDILGSAAGALGPMQRLADPADPSQAGFAYGLLSQQGNPQLQALAIIGRQPVWIFTRHPALTSLTQLRGLRIAAGAENGPARHVAQLLLAQAQLDVDEVQWVARQGLDAANDLLDGKIDALVAIGSGDSPTARLLTHSPGIQMLGVERATTVAAREPRLRPFVLPQGTIELRGDVPSRDLTMLYTGTHLLVRTGMHPALQRALLDAATDIHSPASFLQRQSEFPDMRGTDFPLSPEAQHYALGDRPWLESALPYWWAQLAALVLYALLPILLLAMVALVWIPQLFSLHVNAVLSHYYGELKFLENDIEHVVTETPLALKNLLAKLDAIEQQVAALDLPDRYADRWYTLREHLAAARERLLTLRAR